MRDCKNCKHLIMYDYKNKSYSCEKWECKFEPKEQEPKTGHWKSYLKEGLRYQCSACDSRFDTPWEYCPHCGVKMAESEK